MSETRITDMHELAHRYYTGELSYESYRNERTCLLDRVTQQASNEMSTSKTQPVLERTRVMPVSSSRRHRPVWLLIVIVVVVAVLVWLMKTGWITISLDEIVHGVTATSVTGPDLNSY